MSVTTITKCDICTTETSLSPSDIPCMFTTEQTEGRSVKPYLALVKMDICVGCRELIIINQPLVGSGAMGHNNYKWRGE